MAIRKQYSVSATVNQQPRPVMRSRLCLVWIHGYFGRNIEEGLCEDNDSTMVIWVVRLAVRSGKS